MRQEIDIFGRKYTVVTEYDARYIDRLTYYVNEKIRELVRRNPRLEYSDACALCLLNAADDYMQNVDALARVQEQRQEEAKTRDGASAELEKSQRMVKQANARVRELEREAIAKDNEIVRLKMQLEESYRREQVLREQSAKRDGLPSDRTGHHAGSKGK